MEAGLGVVGVEFEGLAPGVFGGGCVGGAQDFAEHVPGSRIGGGGMLGVATGGFGGGVRAGGEFDLGQREMQVAALGCLRDGGEDAGAGVADAAGGEGGVGFAEQAVEVAGRCDGDGGRAQRAVAILVALAAAAGARGDCARPAATSVASSCAHRSLIVLAPDALHRRPRSRAYSGPCRTAVWSRGWRQAAPKPSQLGAVLSEIQRERLVGGDSG